MPEICVTEQKYICLIVRNTSYMKYLFINARYSLAHTKAGARSGDAGNTAFPLGFYWVGCAVAMMLSIPLKLDDRS